MALSASSIPLSSSSSSSTTAIETKAPAKTPSVEIAPEALPWKIDSLKRRLRAHGIDPSEIDFNQLENIKKYEDLLEPLAFFAAKRAEATPSVTVAQLYTTAACKSLLLSLKVNLGTTMEGFLPDNWTMLWEQMDKRLMETDIRVLPFHGLQNFIEGLVLVIIRKMHDKGAEQNQSDFITSICTKKGANYFIWQILDVPNATNMRVTRGGVSSTGMTIPNIQRKLQLAGGVPTIPIEPPKKVASETSFSAVTTTTATTAAVITTTTTVPAIPSLSVVGDDNLAYELAEMEPLNIAVFLGVTPMRNLSLSCQQVLEERFPELLEILQLDQHGCDHPGVIAIRKEPDWKARLNQLAANIEAIKNKITNKKHTSLSHSKFPAYTEIKDIITGHPRPPMTHMSGLIPTFISECVDNVKRSIEHNSDSKVDLDSGNAHVMRVLGIMRRGRTRGRLFSKDEKLIDALGQLLQPPEDMAIIEWYRLIIHQVETTVKRQVSPSISEIVKIKDDPEKARLLTTSFAIMSILCHQMKYELNYRSGILAGSISTGHIETAKVVLEESRPPELKLIGPVFPAKKAAVEEKILRLQAHISYCCNLRNPANGQRILTDNPLPHIEDAFLGGPNPLDGRLPRTVQIFRGIQDNINEVLEPKTKGHWQAIIEVIKDIFWSNGNGVSSWRCPERSYRTAARLLLDAMSKFLKLSLNLQGGMTGPLEVMWRALPAATFPAAPVTGSTSTSSSSSSSSVTALVKAMESKLTSAPTGIPAVTTTTAPRPT